MDSTESTPPSSFQRTVLRACASCARAKAKCVAGVEPDGKCQRCHRLQKRCEPAAIQPRSLPRKRKQPTTDLVPKNQVEKLEQKLDGLVTLLKSAQNPQPDSNHISTAIGRGEAPVEYMSTADSTSVPNPHTNAFSSAQGAASNIPPPPQIVGPTQDDLNVMVPFKGIGPTTGFCQTFESPLRNEGMSNMLLKRFRDEMSPCSPFIVLLPSMTADQLRQERPFLFSCIMAISCHDTAQQLQLGKQVIKQLAERMVVNTERSLDLLLGIITYAGCNHHMYNIPQLNMLIASASTLLCDLGLNRPVPTIPPNRSIFEAAVRESSVARYLALINTVRSLEEKRAFLGCFFISSWIATFFKRTQIIRYSPYVEECLQALDENGTHPNDKIATSLVRLQIISEKIHESPWHDRANFTGVSAATIFIMNSLKERLNQFRQSLPQEVNENAIIVMYFHATEASLYEIGLSKQQAQIINSGPQFQRVDALYACLQATKSLWDAFFTIPTRDFFNFSIMTCSNLSSSMIILQLLCTFEHPEWNLTHVREMMDFNKLIDRLTVSFYKVQNEPGCEDMDLFGRMAKKIGYMRDYVEARSADQYRDQVPEAQSVQAPQSINAGDFPDFLDDAWLKDIFGPWDFQSSLGMP